MNKRYGNRWSASIGGGYTGCTTSRTGFPQQPEQPGAEDRTVVELQGDGSYDAP